MTTAARILIVDDDRQSRLLISRVLKRAGYSTYVAETGEEALAAAKSERPALVIVEALLPGVSGYEVCHELKDEFGETLPIVFVSLLVDGLNQSEMAEKLYISPKTVGKHIEHILAKLGVHSRAQAVAVAVREGLIEAHRRVPDVEASSLFRY